jgi:hypothetical protein
MVRIGRSSEPIRMSSRRETSSEMPRTSSTTWHRVQSEDSGGV